MGHFWGALGAVLGPSWAACGRNLGACHNCQRLLSDWRPPPRHAPDLLDKSTASKGSTCPGCEVCRARDRCRFNASSTKLQALAVTACGTARPRQAEWQFLQTDARYQSMRGRNITTCGCDGACRETTRLQNIRETLVTHRVHQRFTRSRCPRPSDQPHSNLQQKCTPAPFHDECQDYVNDAPIAR